MHVYALLPLEETELGDATKGPFQIAHSNFPKRLTNYTDSHPYKVGLEEFTHQITDQMDALKKQSILCHHYIYLQSHTLSNCVLHARTP